MSCIAQNWPCAPADSTASLASSRVRVDLREREVAKGEHHLVTEDRFDLAEHDERAGAIRALEVPVLDHRYRCLHPSPDMVLPSKRNR